MRIVLVITFYFLGRVSLCAQDSLATVHIYQAVVTEKGSPVYEIYHNGVAKGKLQGKSIVSFRCKPGINLFNDKPDKYNSFKINLKPSLTYFIEFTPKAFHHVSKEEALRDLPRINSYASVLVKDTDPETFQPTKRDTSEMKALFIAPRTRYIYKDYTIPVSLESNRISLGITSYGKDVDKSVGRAMFLRGHRFLFIIAKERVTQQIFDDDGLLIATVGLKGTNQFNITLKNGDVFSYNKLDKNHWNYSLKGNVVMQASIQRVDKVLTMDVEYFENIFSEALFLSCMERGINILNDKQVDISGGAIATSVLRALVH